MQALALFVHANVVELGLQRALESARWGDPGEDRRLVGALEELGDYAPDVGIRRPWRDVYV